MPIKPPSPRYRHRYPTIQFGCEVLNTFMMLSFSISRSGSGRFRPKRTCSAVPHRLGFQSRVRAQAASDEAGPSAYVQRLSICQGGSPGAENALASLLDGLLRLSPVLRVVFIVLRCAHFFNCFQRLNCQLTVNLGESESA